MTGCTQSQAMTSKQRTARDLNMRDKHDISRSQGFLDHQMPTLLPILSWPAFCELLIRIRSGPFLPKLIGPREIQQPHNPKAFEAKEMLGIPMTRVMEFVPRGAKSWRCQSSEWVERWPVAGVVHAKLGEPAGGPSLWASQHSRVSFSPSAWCSEFERPREGASTKVARW